MSLKQGCSDHLRSRISLNNVVGEHKKLHKPFKFVNAVAGMVEFKPMVDIFWKETEATFMSTSTMFRFTKKLKALKPLIRNLAKERLGNLVKRIKEAYATLCQKQEMNLMNPSPQALIEELEAYHRWDHVAAIEDKFLKQRSKLHWLQTGGQNSKTFHRAVTARAAQNSIREIQRRDGTVTSKGEEIKEEAECFFREFLQRVPDDFKGSEFVLAIQSFFVKGFLPKGVNSTILSLIPKKSEASEMKDYRPISCCNFIAGNQSAFVKHCLLIENLMLATELVKDYHKDSMSSRCALKIDISKTFDSVQWPFLRNVLVAMEFPPEYIHWIMLCVTTASFSVQVNGELAGYFHSTRGLRQIEGIVETFAVFGSQSGLNISLEKSTIYFAGSSIAAPDLVHFPFEIGQLPVCYLGRLNLISLVLWSICNFWLAAFRLPRECIREIYKLCSAYLWSGPTLNPSKAKITWEDVCKPKQEGGLGLRSLKEANDVSCLKLIWRMVSSGNSLWVKWIDQNLLHGLFWSIKDSTTLGSWMWRKLLKYRDVAKSLCKMEVRNGSRTSFWFDDWSGLGRLVEVVGDRYFDLGVARQATVAEAWAQRRRQASFSTKNTWNQIRTASHRVAWYDCVWFAYNTPKYSFCVWLAVRDRLSTGDRMLQWNQSADSSCAFCGTMIESRDHLFFTCSNVTEIWGALPKNIFRDKYTTNWAALVTCVADRWPDRVVGFIARYLFPNYDLYSLERA
ncbi:PREDICTED: uncharacterized protein LOC109125398 [Camelina sativa]|uniref:Uncharacterized protein LOC109125398 n=1 Tax=Camelina sativa TaxID=90675 RepID=A0ABM1Q709_CAMSA|nr:PREDICTED: uncharacterized protein LOC109125398 [Camelina sativa]